MTRASGHRWWVPAIIAAVILLTTDDRHAGVVADGRQMDWTAIAITESGTIGQARARDLTIARPQGDAVSRYGVAMSIAQIPAALAAPVVEARQGAGASQPLFLIAPIVLVLVTGAFAAGAARSLGAGHGAQSVAMLLATLGSPLASYGGFDTSESLQAAALTAVFAWSLRAARATSVRHAAAAGAAAGIAVLAKSSMLVVAPLAALPLLAAAPDVRIRLVARAAAVFAIVLGAWLAFEIARFGRPFAAYGGEGFTHPFVDGAWRLLVGPNKGVVWYFPPILVVIFSARRLAGDHQRSLALAAAVLPFVALLLLAAPWWAWDGAFGWGPRLLVPGLPLLGVCAAVDMARWRRGPRVALVAVSIAINAFGVLQHPVPLMNEELAEAWPVASSDLAAGLPFFAKREDGAAWRVAPHVIQSMRASATPLLAHPRAYFRNPALHVWGSGFFPKPGALPYARVYDAGLTDQVLRAQHMRELDLAERLQRQLATFSADGLSDALRLETFRLRGEADPAAAYLMTLPMDRRRHPAVNVVLALFERDRRSDDTARAFLRSIAEAFPNSPIQQALRSPLDQWPSDFASMTEDVSLQVGAK